MSLSKASILVVDDEPALRHLCKKWLTSLGCASVNTAPNGEAALALLRSASVDLVLTDVSMPLMDGVSLVRCIAKHGLCVPSIVFASGYGDVDRREMYDLGVEAFISKPFEHAELLAALECALADRSTLWRSAMSVAPRQTMSLRVSGLASKAREDAICLGRGGFSAVTNLPLCLGKVSFECSFEDGQRQMTGEGYVRWNSRMDHTVGIEFAHLHASCHSWVVKEIADRNPCSFIPGA